MVAQDIVIRPIITEKSMAGIGMKKYTFEVAKSATKVDMQKSGRRALRRKGQQGQHPACARTSPPPGKYRGLHSFLEEGRRYPDRGQQVHRIL